MTTPDTPRPSEPRPGTDGPEERPERERRETDRRGLGLSVDLNVPARVRATFDAEPGEVIAVVGPNGAGKSSLVKVLAGLIDGVGRAQVGERELLVLDARFRRIGMVHQEGWLFPHLSALRNVAYGPRSLGVPKAEAHARAAHWLTAFGLGDLQHRTPSELSGGQAQRISIARALAVQPDLLLLDEPLTGLDVAAATALRIELAQHLADFDGVTLLVTHSALDALSLATRILVLQEGRIVQDGTPHQVAAAPATAHVARLLGLNLVTRPEGAVTFTPSSVAVSLTEPTGSPRLRWSGTVAEVTPWGEVLRLAVRTRDGDLLADVTPASAAELGLVPGREVWLAVKQTAVEPTTPGAVE